MSMGTSEKLSEVIRSLVTDSSDKFHGCVITNERGLIVAAMDDNTVSNESLAAMMSLLSDTAQRINESLDLGTPKTMAILSDERRLLMHEFRVQGRRFRIGAIVSGRVTSRRLKRIRGLFSRGGIEHTLEDAAKRVVSVLEERA